MPRADRRRHKRRPPHRRSDSAFEFAERGAPIVVAIPSLGANSVALCDQLRAVDKSKISKRIGAISAAEMALIEASVKTVFGLS